MSYVDLFDEGMERISLKDICRDAGRRRLLGERMMERYGTWPMYSKFFDYEGPLFHHLHLDFEAAARVGRLGKPEAYYYPASDEQRRRQFPLHLFRLLPRGHPGRGAASAWRAMRLRRHPHHRALPRLPHPAGHRLVYPARGGACPRLLPDLRAAVELRRQFGIRKRGTTARYTPTICLSENCPEDKKRDLDYILDLMDWDKNVDPRLPQALFPPAGGVYPRTRP